MSAKKKGRLGFQPGNQEWRKAWNVGRLSKVKDLRELARNMSVDAMKAVHDALQDDDNRVKLMAAQIILDRGYGKAAPMDPEAQDSLQAAHLEALKAVTAGARAELVTPEKQAALREQLEALPKIRVIDAEDVNDINDLDGSQVNAELTRSSEESDEEEK